jgi:stage IV sporulation protein FB
LSEVKTVFLSAMEEELPQTYTVSSAWRTAASLLLYILVYYALFRDLRSILILVFVIIIHEGGHFLAMKKFGYRDLKIFFIPFFGAFVSGKSHQASPVQRAIMILSGPLPGILIGAVIFSLAIIVDSKNLLQPALLFIVLNAINLLPVSPLDGGQFLQVLFPASNKMIQTIVTLILIAVITWLAFRTRNYLLLILDVFLFYRLSILFGEKRQEPEHKSIETGINPDYIALNTIPALPDMVHDSQDEIKPSTRVLLLLLWLIGMLIPLTVMLIMAINPGRFF